MRKLALSIIDFFYPPFKNWFSIGTFRYMASGGFTAASGIIAYFVIYNYVLHQQAVHVNGYLVTGHIAALAIESVFTFLVGFTLNKYLVFTQSNLKGRIQLFRYGTVVCTNILLNYALMKILVDGFMFYPSIAKALITVVLAIFSYFSQKYFSFRVKKNV
ncbi:GtrA family protein [Pedobacter helvus]|uniref:GtrA family protein n=1 Tax=Pedobacter helvus TaxID=2563444 RepID=A0ABW9JFP6_9SPHI|nr:GtrA family protein [Pedobacter ureilyticus]